MSKISVLIFSVFLTAVVLGLSNSESADGKPGYCHDYGIDIKEGETVPAPIGNCGSLSCLNAATNDVGFAWCGLFAHKQGCELQNEDPTKPWPECCGRDICKDDN